MGGKLRTLLAHVPVIGRLAGGRRKKFTNSADYWERHYGRNRDSGPGSYGKLAEFKAETINEFVRAQGVKSVVEFGCGDGNQLSLAQYPSYVELDVSLTVVNACREKFRGDRTKTFHHLGSKEYSEREAPIEAELALSLDVLFHLVEDDVFEKYMCDLFSAGQRYVIIYASDFERPPEAPHMKYRKFTDFVERRCAGWTLIETVKNRYPFEEFGPDEGSISDFYLYEKLAA